MAFRRISVILFMLFALLLATGSNAHASPILPLQTGLWYEYQSHDSAVPPDEWVMRTEFQDKVTIEGKEYFKAQQWGYDDPTSYAELYLRCDDTAVYVYDTRLNVEVITFMLGTTIGTTWTYPKKLPDGTLGETHILIKDILSAYTVPYGTFSNVYLLESYFDPDGPAPNSPYLYNYFVAGVGLIKMEEYWADFNPPIVHALADMGVVPLPPSLVLLGSGLLGLLALRRRIF
jgi:hypothetical protein